MKKTCLKTLSFVTATVLTVACSACATGEFSGYKTARSLKANEFFGTTSDVVIYYDGNKAGENERAKKVISEVETKFAEIELALSGNKDGGDIARFNSAPSGATVEVSKTTYEAVKATQEIYAQTEGAYNPAVSPLVDLWGFTPRFYDDNYTPTTAYDREKDTLPDEKYVEAFRSLLAYESIETEDTGTGYRLIKPQTSVTVEGVGYAMKIDLGGYGKGYASDRAVEIIEDAGFTYGYVSLGGSSLRVLNYPSSQTEYAWKVKFTHPDHSDIGAWYAYLFGKNEGVSTSGDYERYFEVDGVRYSHLIDPTTGKPTVNGVRNATVVGGDSASADALTTALCVMGREKAISFINENLKDRKVCFTIGTSDGIAVYTNVERSKITLNTQYPCQLLGTGDGEGSVVCR